MKVLKELEKCRDKKYMRKTNWIEVYPFTEKTEENPYGY